MGLLIDSVNKNSFTQKLLSMPGTENKAFSK